MATVIQVVHSPAGSVITTWEDNHSHVTAKVIVHGHGGGSAEAELNADNVAALRDLLARIT
jgi:hypothetical protein